jgi:glucose-6-phosphate 1-dehydrogenase
MDYADPRTFTALRQVLGDAKHPVHYLAIPPSMFETVVEQLSKSDSARGARVVIEKPFGRDLASARELNRVLHSGFPETAISASITISARKPSTTSSRSASQTPSSSRSGTDATYRTSRLTENFGVAGRGYEEAGAIRDVIQNHLLQVVTLLTCEPPAALTTEWIRDERAKLLTSVRPLRGRSHHLDPVGERLGVEELGSPARQAGRDEESKGRAGAKTCRRPPSDVGRWN